MKNFGYYFIKCTLYPHVFVARYVLVNLAWILFYCRFYYASIKMVDAARWMAKI